MDKTKHGKSVPTLEVVEVEQEQCDLTGNQYQQKVDIFYTTAHNKSFA